MPDDRTDRAEARAQAVRTRRAEKGIAGRTFMADDVRFGFDAGAEWQARVLEGQPKITEQMEDAALFILARSGITRRGVHEAIRDALALAAPEPEGEGQ